MFLINLIFLCHCYVNVCATKFFLHNNRRDDCCFLRLLRRSQALVQCLAESFYCMFEKLRKKWKVNALQLTLILCTFAIGGSLTGFAGKKIMNVLSIEMDWLWAIIYILLVTIIWPIMVLLISIPFGQFRFFSNYTRKLGQKLGLIKVVKSSESKQS